MEKLMKIVPWILVIGLFVAVAFAWTKWRQAKYDLSVAEANDRAMVDTVRRYKTEFENAASKFQLQEKINQDSLKQLETALGTAVREQRLTARALQSARIETERVRKSLESQISMLETVSPEGREERIEALVLDKGNVKPDEVPIVGEIVVAIPADTLQSAEWELSLELLPFEIQTSLACSPEKDAVAVFQTPPWATATPTLGVVDPEICHGPRPKMFAGLQLSAGNLLIGGAMGAALALLATAVF